MFLNEIEIRQMAKDMTVDELTDTVVAINMLIIARPQNSENVAQVMCTYPEKVQRLVMKFMLSLLFTALTSKQEGK